MGRGTMGRRHHGQEALAPGVAKQPRAVTPSMAQLQFRLLKRAGNSSWKLIPTSTWAVQGARAPPSHCLRAPEERGQESAAFISAEPGEAKVSPRKTTPRAGRFLQSPAL